MSCSSFLWPLSSFLGQFRDFFRRKTQIGTTMSKTVFFDKKLQMTKSNSLSWNQVADLFFESDFSFSLVNFKCGDNFKVCFLIFWIFVIEGHMTQPDDSKLGEDSSRHFLAYSIDFSISDQFFGQNMGAIPEALFFRC